MQKVILISLMLCSLIFSNDLSYVKKELNDTTTIIRLTVPDDSLVYTCMSPSTYANTIKKLNDGKISQEQLGICKDNMSIYNKLDTLYTSRNSVNLELSKLMTEAYNEAHKDLITAEADKYTFGMYGSIIGLVLGILIATSL